MDAWKPVVNPKVAEEFKKLGYVEDRDFYVSPDMTDEEIARVLREQEDPDA